MTAVNKPLYIEQGATFTLGFNWHREGPVVDGVVTPGDPYDLTGCTARMQIRRRQGETPLLTATSELPVDAAAVAAGAGRIRLGGATGRIDITLTDEDTDLISARTAVYDLEVEWPYVLRVVALDFTTGSTAVTGPANTFSTADVGASISAASVAAGTKILAIASDTSATLSVAATGTAVGDSVTILYDQLRPRVDRLLQGAVTVDPNVTQVAGEDPVVTE